MNDTFTPGTVKPEVDYEEIARLAAKLGLPVPLMHLAVESRLPDGTIDRTYSDRSRTWNRNFWNHMLISFMGPSTSPDATFGAGSDGIKQPSGTIAWYNLYNGSINLIGAINVSTNGIVAGTSSGAESFEGYMLGAQCNQGTGSGQLSHQAQAAPAKSYNSATRVWTLTMSRVFNNNSGAGIVIAETGIIGAHTYASANTALICRDVLASAVTVANGGQLTVTYTLSLTFPA
jgi:hypothetical protein